MHWLIIGSGNGLSPVLCQAITFTSADRLVMLTHWGRDKMAAIFHTTYSNAFSWMKMYEFWLRFHWSLFLRVKLTNNNIPALVQIMSWCPWGDKPLSEPMMAQLTDVNMRHSASMRLNELIGPLGSESMKFEDYNNFLQKKLENFACKMVAILFRS